MEPNETKLETLRRSQRTYRFVILPIVALAFFYVGGWYIAWGRPFWTRAALYVGSEGVAVRVNDLYYGMFYEPRLFDAPFISFVCFVLGWVALSVGFARSTESE